MKKICLMIHSLGIGGMERVMSELIGHISEKKETELHLVLIGKKREVVYPIPDSVIVYRPAFEFDDSSRTLYTLKTIRFIRRTVKEIDPDTVLSFGELWNNLVLLSLLRTGYPVYVSDRCRPDKYLGRGHEFLRRKLYPNSAGIIAQTEAAREFYQQMLPRDNVNIEVIGNPIRQIPPPARPESKENIILTVGRLIDTKHHDRLIRIFKSINPKGWKLVIVGGNAIKQDGMSRLKKLTEELELNGSVELTGELNSVDRYYQKSKIFAFTSSSEGFPNVIGEAMSAGLPVVAYDCVAGPSTLINDGVSGFLVPTFDDKRFKQKLKMLIHDEEKRQEMGAASKEFIKKYESGNISELFYTFITAHT